MDQNVMGGLQSTILSQTGTVLENGAGDMHFTYIIGFVNRNNDNFSGRRWAPEPSHTGKLLTFVGNDAWHSPTLSDDHFDEWLGVLKLFNPCN